MNSNQNRGIRSLLYTLNFLNNIIYRYFSTTKNKPTQNKNSQSSQLTPETPPTLTSLD